ncbi:MAG: metallopeptidase family protein [Dehalococcoidales bacterium]|nr:metallopeptidase family protein [Dehalococcoidales bacterium]
MDKQKFEELVAAVVENLPEEFAANLDNIDVVVEDEPTPAQLRNARLRRTHTLLGLYEGIPLTGRSSNYGLVPPDKITIFQKPIEEACKGEHEIMAEISKVVKHEIAHHFGIDDARLRQIERGRA